LLTLLRLQQTDETGLFKVMVGRQGFEDAPLLHYDEAGTIYQTPIFILTVSKQLPGLRVQDHINMDDFYIRRDFDTFNECHNGRAGNPERTG
jgi:hypothetical protein